MEKESIEKIILGIIKVYNMIEGTIGPNGKNVIINNGLNPIIINDGVSIIQNINFEDEYENIGALLMKQVSGTVEDKVGDGTTSAVIIAHAIITSGFQFMKNGISFIEIKNGLEYALDLIVNEIKKKSTKITKRQQIYSIAYTSTKSQTLAKLIQKAFTLSKNNIIQVEERIGDKSYVDFINGYIYEKGLINRYMLDDKQQVELTNVNVYILNYEVISYKEIELIDIGTNDILLIVQKIDKSIVQKIMVRNLNSNNKIYVILGSNNINIIEEIRKYTNSKIINNRVELTNYLNNNLEVVDNIIINIEKTVFIKKDQQTLGKKVAIIKLQASSEIELNDQKLRISDAINSTNNALKEGYVCGGGVPLYETATKLEKSINDYPGELQIGLSILTNAIKQPFYSICKNSGYSINQIIKIKKQLPEGYGLNAISNNWSDLKEDGVLDATSVIITELFIACNVSKMILSSNNVINKKNNIYNDSIFPL